MQVRIVRRLTANRHSDASDVLEYLLEVTQLTIGRAGAQAVQLPDAAVALHHAVVRWRSGKPRIEACAGCAFELNGRRCAAADLTEGDVVRIGRATITVLGARPGEALAIAIDEEAAASEHELATVHTTSLRGAGLGVRHASWLLVLGVIAVFLIPPLATALYAPARPALRSIGALPSDRLWEPGPLHETHRFIGGDCDKCHVTPFRRVANAQCTACHRGVQHHVRVGSRDVALFDERRCAGCHMEHQEPDTLVRRDDRLCTRCHGRLRSMKKDTKLANVTDFGSDHPDFNVPVPEHSGLTFSHAVHLDPRGIKAAHGYEVLTCRSCHQQDASGRRMLPIHMETRCARCHSLQFDEHDPTTTVPHGNLPRVFATLQAHFIRAYLDSSAPHAGVAARRPGGEAEIMTREQQRRARDWADRESLRSASELLDKRVCVQCHHVTRVPGASGFDQWRIDPVRIKQNWLPLAHFSHASHATTLCKTCHGAAAWSKSSSDVLMPSIATCRDCHGDTDDASRLASDCGMCHRFHLPGRGPFESGTAR